MEIPKQNDHNDRNDGGGVLRFYFVLCFVLFCSEDLGIVDHECVIVTYST